MKKKSHQIENIRKINSKKNWKIESNRIESNQRLTVHPGGN